jgi:hypothetical protein
MAFASESSSALGNFNPEEALAVAKADFRRPDGGAAFAAPCLIPNFEFNLRAGASL